MSDDTNTRPPLPLARLLGGILVDLAQAQHLSNEYTARSIAPIYGADPILRCLPVPNGLLEEVEMELRLASASASDRTGDAESAAADAIATVGHLASTLGRGTLAIVREQLERRIPALDRPLQPKAREVSGRLAAPSMQRHVAARIEALVHPCPWPASSERAAEVARRLDDEMVQHEACEALVSVILDHPEVALLVPEGAPERAEARMRITALVRTRFAESRAKLESRRGAADPTLLVAIGAGSTLVGSIRIKAVIRDQRWVVGVEGEPGELVPMQQ